ncbi:MAG: PIG-L family deacetylase [Candidatus Latescibacteria bacterium]|nr:PIG-L family deacetylase [Candidatus Latescibacterota bacterium]
MNRKRLRILVFGAHPDDCDIKAGGIALQYSALGHCVKFVSVTNGDTGHFEIGGIELARRRYGEAQASAKVAGITYDVLDIHNGELEPSVANRKMIIRIIREFKPDLVLTHRPNDYHPDHRYTSLLVQDAAYIVTVPNMVPLTPHLQYNPVICYLSDHFQKPTPFAPDVVVGIDAVVERKMDMLHCHTSQMYEWLPYNSNHLKEVPKGERARRAWLGKLRKPAFEQVAEQYRDRLVELYGEKQGKKVRYAEAFEACEYGGRLTKENMKGLFPFFG